NRVLRLFVLATVTTSLFAQVSPNSPTEKQLNASPSPLATSACQSTFTSGSGLNYMSFCITVNGNVINFTAPQNFLQQFSREGYGICDETGGNVSYWDD